jgi:hypothetical protein
MPYLTKKDLLVLADPYFSQGEKVMYATSDGNFFYEKDKNHASNHSKAAKLALYELKSEDADQTDDEDENLDNLPADQQLGELLKAQNRVKLSLSRAKKPELIEKLDYQLLEIQASIDKLNAENEGQ